jgi:hypothetical protein
VDAKARVREQKPMEDRRDYLLLVAAAYLSDCCQCEELIFYDGAECDAGCLAAECLEASESEY